MYDVTFHWFGLVQGVALLRRKPHSWSQPAPVDGRHPSPRGPGTVFVSCIASVAIATAGCVTINLGSATSTSRAADCASRTSTYRNEQVSMEPALQPGDLVLVVPSGEYGRGDIVVFRPPADEGGDTPFVKRVIAVSGDTIAIQDGRVIVNGTELDEPYVYPGRSPFEATEPQSDETTWTVPPNELFVLGDHRESSVDSRSFGAISAGSVLGRATYRCSPSPGPIT